MSYRKRRDDHPTCKVVTLMTTSTVESLRFNFSVEAQRAFTHGDCWHLAETIHSATGYPLITAQWEEATDSYWSHVANRLPDGRIADIEGIWSEEEWLQRWHIKSDTFFIDKEDRTMFVKTWLKADWQEEALYCDLEICYPEISEHVTTYAKAILAQIA